MIWFKESGPWTAAEDGKSVHSADFSHDVTLRIDGDFNDDEQRKAYAQEICRRLNAMNPEEQQ